MLEILRKNKKKTLDIQNTVTKMKNAFDGLFSKLDKVKERIKELEDISIGNF